MCVQVTLALYGGDIPTGRNPDANLKRKAVYDIISPYIFSPQEIEIVAEAPQKQFDLWLESFTASLKGVRKSLEKMTKSEYSKCSPPYGASPARIHGDSVGMPPHSTILDR